MEPFHSRISLVEQEDQAQIRVKAEPNRAKIHLGFGVGFFTMIPITFFGENLDFFLAGGWSLLYALILLITKFTAENYFSGQLSFERESRSLKVSDGFGGAKTEGLSSQTLACASSSLLVEREALWFLDRVCVRRKRIRREDPHHRIEERIFFVRLMLISPTQASAPRERLFEHQERLDGSLFESHQDAPLPEGATLFMTSQAPRFLFELTCALNKVTSVELLDLATMSGVDGIRERALKFPLRDPQEWEQFKGVKVRENARGEEVRLSGMSLANRLILFTTTSLFSYGIFKFFELGSVTWSMLFFFAVLWISACLSTRLTLSADAVRRDTMILGLFSVHPRTLSWADLNEITLVPDQQELFYVVLRGEDGSHLPIGLNGQGHADWLLRYLWAAAAKRCPAA